ncbi:hypothetical protein VTI74DRAFT_590 [Chaetomium olivicolor]
MNRSRYVPHTSYSISPYQQPYGSMSPPPSQIQPGLMPTQPLAMPPSTYGNPQPPAAPSRMTGHSPIQTSLSPQSIWSSNFANGPIIEDLCVPPPPQFPMSVPLGSPPNPGLPHRMVMPLGPVHPNAMPQVQNVYGVSQPMPQPYLGGMHPAQQHLQGVGIVRTMGMYPPGPWGSPVMPNQQLQPGTGMGMAYPQRTVDPSTVLARPRLETGFPTPIGPPGGGERRGNGMGQMGMPEGGSEREGGGEELPPLTPGEEMLRGFLGPDFGELGHP